VSTTPPAYCGHCGGLRDASSLGSSGTEGEAARDHTVCDLQLALEPPRFCVHCRRRMKVQVTPRGWSATCVEHGELSG
jgi:hypothetical protein